MIKKSNLFALIGVLVLGGSAVIAQDKPREERIERTIEVVTMGGESYLGVETEEINKDNFGKFGLREVRGVAIEKVSADSPAKKAGLQDGDVIIRFNGEEVSSFRKLTRLISETAPDHQAKIVVLRNGSEREFTVTIGKRPKGEFETGNFQMRMPQMPNGRIIERVAPMIERDLNDVFVWNDGQPGVNFIMGSTRQIGVGVTMLTKQLGNYFGITDGKGVLINNVNENSPAAKSGLKAGDVIVEVEGKSVSNTMELIRGINEKKEGDVNLTIVRDRNRQTVKITPDKMTDKEMPLRVMKPKN